MPATRAQLVCGPAKVVRDTGILYTQDDIGINIVQTTIPHRSSAHGHLFETADSATVEASFTPEGRWDSLTRAMLWPYLNFTRGASIFGADMPTVFHGVDGGKHTIHASAIGNFPSIHLSAGRSMIGQVTILGVRKTGIPWSTDNSLYKSDDTDAVFADASFLREEIIIQDYTGVWGDVTGFGAIKTQDGWTIEGNLQLEPIATDEGGILDYKYVSLEIMAKCSPVEVTMANLLSGLKVQNTLAARGRRLSQADGSTDDLTITGTADASVIVVLKHAGLKTAGFRFGSSVLREGEIGFVAARPFSSGATADMLVLA